MCCTLYLKSSLYNLITALKRGTQYSCFPRQVGVLCPLSSVSPHQVTAAMSGAGAGCWGTPRPGWSARSPGAAARAGSRTGEPAAASRRSGSSPSQTPGAALSWRAGSETRSWPGIRELCQRGGEISQAGGVLALWVSIIFYLGALCTNCNTIPTWVSESLRSALNSARSEMLRYCFSLYFFSRLLSCAVVKGVRGFLLGLCFLRRQRIGPGGGRRVMSEKFREFSEIFLPEKMLPLLKVVLCN